MWRQVSLVNKLCKLKTSSVSKRTVHLRNTMLWDGKSEQTIICKTFRMVSKCCYPVTSVRFYYNSYKLYKYSINFVFTCTQHRHRSTSQNDDGGLTCSSTIIQDGLDVKELPIIVKKTSNMDSMGVDNQKHYHCDLNDKAVNKNWQTFESVDPVIRINLDTCSSKDEIFRYLELVHLSDVTPLTALNILDRLSDFQSDLYIEPPDESDLPVNDTDPSNSFSRSAMLWILCLLVCTSENVGMVLAGLKTSIKGHFHPEMSDLFIQQCLHFVSEDKMDVEQVCEFIQILVQERCQQSGIIELLWLNIMHQSSNINEHNILKVYRIIPYLTTTQKVVLNALEKKTTDLFWKLTNIHVTTILRILSKSKQEHRKLFSLLTKWTNINIHTLSENDLRKIIESLGTLNYIDCSIQRAIDRYMKAKGNRIKDVMLLKEIADYCIQFKWRSIPTLEAISKFVPQYSDQILVKDLKSLVKVFGIVNHQPNNSFKFFETVEQLLLMKFSQFRPDMIIEMMMSCIYLQRYPLNFVQKIFSPFFLDRINTSLEQTDIQKTHNSLKLLDWALTLECRQYRGPLLPRNPLAKSLKRDARVVKMVASLSNIMADIVGGEDKFGSNILLPKLPLSEMYIVDFVIHLNKDNVPIPYQRLGGIYKRIAVIIHLPDDYCLNENHLIGHQATRIRHLQLLDYHVVQCDYEVLERLHLSPKEKQEYLKEKIFPAV